MDDMLNKAKEIAGDLGDKSKDILEDLAKEGKEIIDVVKGLFDGDDDNQDHPVEVEPEPPSQNSPGAGQKS